MNRIADDETGALFTGCLMIDWGLSAICELAGCNNKASRIIAFTGDECGVDGGVTFSMCKEHDDQFTAQGSIKATLDLRKRTRQAVPA